MCTLLSLLLWQANYAAQTAANAARAWAVLLSMNFSLSITGVRVGS